MEAKYPQNETIINPYQNQEIIKHKKFVSHLGISFIDLKYVEKNFLYQRTILRKICGQINYGTLNGIFGPKKSGKTILLKCLSGRNKHPLDPDTKLFINPDILTKVIYLENKISNNILLSLTVYETLDYSLRFRSQTLPYNQRESIIKEMIRNLNLYEVQDIYLCNCSREEQIRTLVAMSLATAEKPNIICMDEPFTELDNVGIENFVSLMKHLSRTYSLAVIFTISQILDSDVFSIFDKLYVLARGGLCVYEGSAEHISLFLRESDVIISSKLQTPIERLIKIASKPNELTVRVANRVLATRDDILHFAQKYGIQIDHGIDTQTSSINIGNILDLFNRSLIYKYRTYWRSILIQYLTLICAIIFLIMAFDLDIGLPDSCYNKTNQEIFGRLIILEENKKLEQTWDRHIVTIQGQHLVDENLKFLFVTTISLTLFHLLVSVITLNEEIIVTTNEHRNGFININSFILVKNIADMITPFINTISCCSISYFILYNRQPEQWQENYWRFWSYFWSQFSSVACAQNLGLVISVISVSNKRLANIATFFSSIILIIFAGYLIPLKNIHLWLEIISHASFVKQSYELTLISLYGFDRCSQNNTGSFVLEELGIDQYEHYWRNSIIIATHYLIYCFIFWMILVNNVKKRIIPKQAVSSLTVSNNETLESEWDDYNDDYDYDKSIPKKF